MLLGHDKDGEIKFIFTDEKYLAMKYPNNTAKISNFWGNDHKLQEFFISKIVFQDYANMKQYKIINNTLVKKTDDEIKKIRKQMPLESNSLIADQLIKTSDIIIESEMKHE